MQRQGNRVGTAKVSSLKSEMMPVPQMTSYTVYPNREDQRETAQRL